MSLVKLVRRAKRDVGWDFSSLLPISPCDQKVMASCLLPSAIFFKSSSDDTSRADGLASLSKAGIFAAMAVDSGLSYGESFCFSRISSRSCCIIGSAISRHFWVFRIARGPVLRLSDDTKETSGMAD